MTDKGKGKSIVIGDPRTSNILQGWIARKASDKKTNKFGDVGGGGVDLIEESSTTTWPEHRGRSNT
jgi:hypothetical protein